MHKFDAVRLEFCHLCFLGDLGEVWNMQFTDSDVFFEGLPAELLVTVWAVFHQEQLFLFVQQLFGLFPHSFFAVLDMLIKHRGLH